MVRSMINLTTLPLSFWDYALESATRILNMVPTKKVDKTPYELWYEKVPKLSYLKVWRCEALVKQDTPDKLQQRYVKCIFIGYPKEMMGYYFYFPRENKIVVTGYVEFLEKNLISQEVSRRAEELKEIQEEEDTTPSEITSNIPQEVEGFEPPQPPQEEEILIRRTFSPVADIRAIRILISIATYYDYEIWKMDVKTAFLNGYLDEDIYMVQPEDIILRKNHIPSLQSVKDYLGRCFSMKDLGEAAFILGIKIYRDRSKRLIGLRQNAYMDKILKRYKVDNSKRVRCTRLDVAFTQNITSQFQQNPGELHWTAVKNILKYLRNTKDMFLVYGGNSSTELRVESYCDAAASEAAMEAVWIRKFISGLGIVPTINEPINMYCDNSAAVHYANEPGVQRGARHYLRRYHYVRESVVLGEIKILKVHTDNNLADPFTKALSNRKLTQHARSMGLRPARSFM
ncbi:retrotransposon protein, putative, ty1-copia subclass [Tanacetum coccineum]